MKSTFIILFLLALCAVVSAQGSKSGTFSIPGDSTVAFADSVQVSPQDSIRQKVERKLTVVKREFSYKQQVGLALGMMAFIAFMMTTAQSWNPR